MKVRQRLFYRRLLAQQVHGSNYASKIRITSQKFFFSNSWSIDSNGVIPAIKLKCKKSNFAQGKCIKRKEIKWNIQLTSAEDFQYWSNRTSWASFVVYSCSIGHYYLSFTRPLWGKTTTQYFLSISFQIIAERIPIYLTRNSKCRLFFVSYPGLC